jgi:putative thioredoxin
MASNYILDVNESNFELDVVVHSDTTPVLVDFWAEWSQPSQLLSRLLERLAHEAGGAFRVAHVDADDNPNLVMQMNVHNLPTVKVFDKGGIVAEFSGAQPEALVRQLIARVHTGESDLNVAKGNALMLDGDYSGAEAAFQDALAVNADSGAALLGLAKCHIAQGFPADALVILRAFPASRAYSHAERLIPLAEAMARFEIDQTVDEADELALLFQRAVALAARGNPEAAADGLLELLRQDKNYGKGQARKCMLAILEMLGSEHPEEHIYRNEFNAVLF